MATQDFYLQLKVSYDDDAPEGRVTNKVLELINKAIDCHFPEMIEDNEGSEYRIDLAEIQSKQHLAEDFATLNVKIKALEAKIAMLMATA